MNIQNKLKNRKLLALATSLALAGGFTSGAQAAEWRNGEWTTRVDTTLSYGASWRATDLDPENVGKAANNPAVFTLPYPQQVATPGRWSNNDDCHGRHDNRTQNIAIRFFFALFFEAPQNKFTVPI